MSSRSPDTAIFAAIPMNDDVANRRLHDRLVSAAESEHVLDVAYRVIDTPVGELLLAATGVGLVRVAYACENHEAVLTSLAATIGPRILAAPARLAATAEQMDEYFAGNRIRFELPLDFRLATGFRRAVLGHLPQIGYGCTATYAQVAHQTDSPGAVRAVGTACARNPLPVVVPCHRVVRSDGTAGGYVGGPAAKQALLALEAAA